MSTKFKFMEAVFDNRVDKSTALRIIGYKDSFTHMRQWIAGIAENSKNDENSNLLGDYDFPVLMRGTTKTYDEVMLTSLENVEPHCLLGEFSNSPEYELGEVVNINLLKAPYNKGVVVSIMVLGTDRVMYEVTIKDRTHPKTHTPIKIAVGSIALSKNNPIIVPEPKEIIQDTKSTGKEKGYYFSKLSSMLTGSTKKESPKKEPIKIDRTKGCLGTTFDEHNFY